MKRIISLLSLCVLFAISCDKPTDDTNGITPNKPSAPTTTITILSESISVGKGNGMGDLTYTIENPIDGFTVVASADVEWIHSFTYKASNKVGFSIDANPLYEERSGVITVTYGDSTASATVTQAGKDPQNEIEVVAPYLIGEYYGDYASSNYNFYVAFSSSDYDAKKPLYGAGWKYFLDIYASDAPADYTNIRIPNGVYTLTSNGGVANTLFDHYSIYKEYSSLYAEISQRSYDTATLTVTDDLVMLEVVFNDSTDKYIVKYSGDYTILDKRNQSGGVN
jgi:hypothetical protein